MVGHNVGHSMLHLFLGLKSLVKVSRYHTDGSVFRLHYRVTVMALLAFTFIVTTRQYIGSPIMCVHTKEIPKDVLNTYCWIHPTYTLSSAHWKRVGVDVPHPGVDKTRDIRDKKHVKYYQWVGFCLFFQVSVSNRCCLPMSLKGAIYENVAASNVIQKIMLNFSRASISKHDP